MGTRNWPTTTSEMLDLSPKEFEQFVADLWEQRGYETEWLQLTNDGGRDVIAEKNGERIVLQAKRNKATNRVSGPEVQQYSSILLDETVDGVAIVTTSSFTHGAFHRMTEIPNLEFYHGDRLETLASRYRPKPDVPNQGDPELGRPVESLPRQLGRAFESWRQPNGGQGVVSGSVGMLLSAPFRLLNPPQWVGALYSLQLIGLWLSVQPTAIPAISANTAGALLAVSLLALPVAIYMDVRQSTGSRGRAVTWGLLTLAFTVFAPTYYVYRRFIKPKTQH